MWKERFLAEAPISFWQFFNLEDSNFNFEKKLVLFWCFRYPCVFLTQAEAIGHQLSHLDVGRLSNRALTQVNILIFGLNLHWELLCVSQGATWDLVTGWTLVSTKASAHNQRAAGVKIFCGISGAISGQDIHPVMWFNTYSYSCSCSWPTSTTTLQPWASLERSTSTTAPCSLWVSYMDQVPVFGSGGHNQRVLWFGPRCLWEEQQSALKTLFGSKCCAQMFKM